MQQLLDFFQANPWIWALLFAALAIWGGAIWAIVKSPKFLRKWLWVLLTFLSFSFSWTVGPGSTISIGFPIGALYVLWFWRFGALPSAADLAKNAERRRAEAPGSATRTQVGLLRVAYAIAVLATLFNGWLALSGRLGAMMTAEMGKVSGGEVAFEQSFFDSIRYPQAALMLLIVGLFVFLALRPYWWGS